jgi:2-methylcitrate dehydratase PrpD
VRRAAEVLGMFAVFGGLAIIVAHCTACNPAAWASAAELLANKIACAVANQDKSDAQIIEKCAVQPGDVERVMTIVGESRQASAKAAARASVARCPE